MCPPLIPPLTPCALEPSLPFPQALLITQGGPFYQRPEALAQSTQPRYPPRPRCGNIPCSRFPAPLHRGSNSASDVSSACPPLLLERTKSTLVSRPFSRRPLRISFVAPSNQ